MPLSKRIIPCLDVDKGRVVKGVKFLRLRDAGDPVEIARGYDEQGADELVFLDINASVEGRETMADVVRRVASEIFIPLTVGGGIRNTGDIARMLRAGADKVAINSAAIINPDLVAEAAERFGTQCIVIAIDAKRKKGNTSWEVMSHGGRKHTGKDVLQWAQTMAEAGAGEILLTSVDCDGGKKGYDIELTRTISDAVDIPVIASGGVGKLEHLHEGLIAGRADAVLAASIFHFGQHSVGDAKQYLFQHGVNIRL